MLYIYSCLKLEPSNWGNPLMDNQGWFGEFHAKHIKRQDLWVPVLEILAGNHFVISSSFKHHTDHLSDLLRKLKNRSDSRRNRHCNEFPKGTRHDAQHLWHTFTGDGFCPTAKTWWKLALLKNSDPLQPRGVDSWNSSERR